MKYGKITLIQQVDNTGITKSRPRGYSTYKCKCDCGIIKNIQLRVLKSGRIKSCGCMRGKHIKHGKSGTREYATWGDIKQRCDNPKWNKYYLYGGKGISYPNKWKTFEGFWDDMKEGYSDKLTIDRKDGNKSYSKENCRWATPKKQSNNTSWNKYLTYDGKTLTYSQWEDKTGIKQNTISARINKLGWNIEKTLTTK